MTGRERTGQSARHHYRGPAQVTTVKKYARFRPCRFAPLATGMFHVGGARSACSMGAGRPGAGTSCADRKDTARAEPP